jgi:NAD(P)-dependent dehydrogenase (short-subunit alcohol dehydrogenase family)
MLHKITDKQWDLMLAVHNTAPFRIVKAASPYLVRELEFHQRGLQSI